MGLRHGTRIASAFGELALIRARFTAWPRPERRTDAEFPDLEFEVAAAETIVWRPQRREWTTQFMATFCR